jgi:hypothetical protein
VRNKMKRKKTIIAADAKLILVQSVDSIEA